MYNKETDIAGAFVRFEKCKKTELLPLVRIREKLDEYSSAGDYDGAMRHLEYWLAEASTAGDLRAEFSILNEMMGVGRKKPDREKAMSSAEAALELVSVLGNGDTLSAGTAFVNAGTVFDCFGYPERAIECFESARRIYEEELDGDDDRLGGLYNNMALALSDLERFDEALGCFERALAVMEQRPGGRLEMAVSYLNMADLAERAEGAEAAEDKIMNYLEAAERLLLDPDIPRNAYYAFVCEKCAPGFSYYGWFRTAEELKSAADALRREAAGGRV